MMAEYRERCPSCEIRAGDEVYRWFTLTHESDGAARGRVDIDWVCSKCGKKFKTVSKRSWTDVRGTAARHPGEYRARVERYARKLYFRIFDYQKGAFKDAPEAFNPLVHEFFAALGASLRGTRR